MVSGQLMPLLVCRKFLLYDARAFDGKSQNTILCWNVVARGLRDLRSGFGIEEWGVRGTSQEFHGDLATKLQEELIGITRSISPPVGIEASVVHGNQRGSVGRI